MELTKNNLASQIDSKNQHFPSKNVNFYFSPEQQQRGAITRSQAARYDAMMNASMSDISEDSTSEYDSSVASEDDLDSIVSYEGSQWDDLVLYSEQFKQQLERLKLDLSKVGNNLTQLNHASLYAPALKDIERAPERKALAQERSILANEFKGVQQLSAQLESSYRSQKVKCYKQSSVIGSFFRSDQPTELRMNSIEQIQSVITSVNNDLSKMQIEPKTFAQTDPLMAMKYHVHHLQQAILTIKGAALKEFSAINNSYMLQTSDNSALHNVLQKTFNCEKMPTQEKVDAKAAFDKFNATSKAELKFEEQEKDAVQPTAFTV